MNKNIELKTINGNHQTMGDYEGQVLLIVNTASECGYTHQYEDLQKLYDLYRDYDFNILGFPSNEFGAQEPGSDEEIEKFVTEKFGISFPMFSKTEVNGPNAHPLYKFLKETYPEDVKWNFEKYLIDRDGNVVGHFESKIEPRAIVDDIDELI